MNNFTYIYLYKNPRGAMDWIGELKNDENGTLTTLYSLYRDECVTWLEKHHHCTHEDAVDIFQVSIMIFYDNVRTGKLTKLTSEVKTYLLGIAKNKAFEVVRNKRKFNLEDPNIQTVYSIMGDSDDVSEEQLHKINIAMNKIGNPCLEIFRRFFYFENTIQEITEIMGYKNTNVTKSQKYKCLKRLQSMVLEHKDKNTGY